MNLSSYPKVERAAYEQRVLSLLDGHPEIESGIEFVKNLTDQGLDIKKLKETIVDLITRKVVEQTDDKKFIKRCKEFLKTEAKSQFTSLNCGIS